MLHVCEAPIDVLPYASLMKLKHQDHHDVHILSLGGVQIPRKDSVISCKTPIALEQFLKDHAEINHIVLHLDTARTGRLATRTIQQNLINYHVTNSPPRYGKDVNDKLKTRLGIEVSSEPVLWIEYRPVILLRRYMVHEVCGNRQSAPYTYTSKHWIRIASPLLGTSLEPSISEILKTKEFRDTQT